LGSMAFSALSPSEKRSNIRKDPLILRFAKVLPNN
jgi:hypothetical protein